MPKKKKAARECSIGGYANVPRICIVRDVQCLPHRGMYDVVFNHNLPSRCHEYPPGWYAAKVGTRDSNVWHVRQILNHVEVQPAALHRCTSKRPHHTQKFSRQNYRQSSVAPAHGRPTTTTPRRLFFLKRGRQGTERKRRCTKREKNIER